MKMSKLFGQTLRKPPADAQIASHRLLVQAGFIRQLGAGIFSYLHLARKRLGLDILEAWESGGKPGATDLTGLPMFDERL